MSLGNRSNSSSLRSGQILVGHSNSDPALLRILQEHPHTLGPQHPATSRSPPATPELVRHGGSTPSLNLSYSDRSLPVMGSSRSERSIGLLSSSSSGALPAVQELSDEARFADDSQRSHSSNPPSPQTLSPGMQTTNRGQTEGTEEAPEEFLPTLIEQYADGGGTGATQPSQATRVPNSPTLLSSSDRPVRAGLCEPCAPGAAELDDDAQAALAAGAEWKTVERFPTAHFKSLEVLTVPRSNSWINSRSNVGKIAAAKGKEHAALLTSIAHGVAGTATGSTEDGCSSPATVSAADSNAEALPWLHHPGFVGDTTPNRPNRAAVPAPPQPGTRDILNEEDSLQGVPCVRPPPGKSVEDTSELQLAASNSVGDTSEEHLRRNRSSSVPPAKPKPANPAGDRMNASMRNVYPASTPPGSLTLGAGLSTTVGGVVHPASPPLSLPASPNLSANTTTTSTNRARSPSWMATGAAAGQRPGGYTSPVQTSMPASAVSAAPAASAATTTAGAAAVVTPMAGAPGPTASTGTSRAPAKTVYNAFWPGPRVDTAAAPPGAGQSAGVAPTPVMLSHHSHTSLQS